MQNFDELFDKFMTEIRVGLRLRIQGYERTVKAAAGFTTVNYPMEEGYIKIYFKEDGYLMFDPNEKIAYFHPQKLNRLKGITDEMIGKVEEITYKGTKYRLDNKDDYQFVTRIIIGTPFEIEGEARFSDYLPIDETKGFLSLGWLSYSGERADLVCSKIDPAEVEIIL